MKIGIIDSGIQPSKNILVCQYMLGREVIKEESVIDNNGHGSLMFSIIERVLDEKDTVISLRMNEKEKIDSFMIARGIEFCVDQNVQLINICIGVNALGGDKKLNEVCQMAYDKGISIVAAASNYNEIVYPWACQGVLKVRQGLKADNTIIVKKDFWGIYNIFVNRRRYGEKNRISIGNSVATAYISALLVGKIKDYLCNLKELDPKELVKDIVGRSSDIDVGKLYDKVELVKEYVKFINANEKINWEKCLIVPFCKEMDSVIKYSLNAEVVAGSGGIPTRVAKEHNIDSIMLEDEYVRQYDISSIIIGYLDKIGEFEKSYTEDFLVEFALRNNLNIFSFKKLSKRNEEKIRKKKNIRYKHTEIIDIKKLNTLRKAVPYNLLPHKLVVGVFGTSSKQGKFTCQLNMKKQLEKAGVAVNFIGTEHQSALVGSVLEYPMGYGGVNNIQLGMEDGIEYLQKAMLYVDQMIEGDLILLGGQSWLIPYDIEQQTAIYNLAFLEATRPDYAILVINPEIDNEKYILDTKAILECLYKCDVIGILYSDMKPYSETIIEIKTKRDEKNILEMNKNISKKYGVYAGCINSDIDMKRLIKILLGKLQTDIPS